MKTYKVWVEIEEIDEEADSYVCMECPQSLKEFATVNEAVAFANDLHDSHWDGPLEINYKEENQ